MPSQLAQVGPIYDRSDQLCLLISRYKTGRWSPAAAHHRRRHSPVAGTSGKTSTHEIKKT